MTADAIINIGLGAMWTGVFLLIAALGCAAHRTR